MDTVWNSWLFCTRLGNALSAIPCVVIEGFCATNAHVLSAGIPPISPQPSKSNASVNIKINLYEYNPVEFFMVYIPRAGFVIHPFKVRTIEISVWAEFTGPSWLLVIDGLCIPVEILHRLGLPFQKIENEEEERVVRPRVVAAVP